MGGGGRRSVFADVNVKGVCVYGRGRESKGVREEK